MRRYYLIQETDSNVRHMVFEAQWYWAVKLYRTVTGLRGEILGPCRNSYHSTLAREINAFKCSQCLSQRRFG